MRNSGTRNLRFRFYTLLVAGILVRAPILQAQVVPQYEPNWRSLDLRDTPPWYDQAKIGVLIHWGPFSVVGTSPPQIAETPTGLRRPDHIFRLLSAHGEAPISVRLLIDRNTARPLTYREVARRFKPKWFDPAEWANLVRLSGARYALVSAKSVFGFAMWPSSQSWTWNSKAIGPGRDIVGELLQAFEERGIAKGISYPLADEHHRFYRNDIGRFVSRIVHPQVRDLILTYRPDVLRTTADGDHPGSVWRAEELLSWIYSESRVEHQIVVSDRWGPDAHKRHGYFSFGCENDPRGSFLPRDVRTKWETCFPLSSSLGHDRGNTIDEYVSDTELIHKMIEVVARGGNFLVAIGPNAEGRIPVIERARLRSLGDWLRVNGEAIYETRPWRVVGEGPWVRYTRSGNVVYAVLLRWPGTTLVLDEPNASFYSRFTLLGREGSLNWERMGDRVRISLPRLDPDEMPSDHAWVIKMTVIN